MKVIEGGSAAASDPDQNFVTLEDAQAALRELEQRLTKSAKVLKSLQNEAWQQCEKDRLGGKVEGLQVALSYVQEYLR